MNAIILNKMYDLMVTIENYEDALNPTFLRSL